MRAQSAFYDAISAAVARRAPPHGCAPSRKARGAHARTAWIRSCSERLQEVRFGKRLSLRDTHIAQAARPRHSVAACRVAASRVCARLLRDRQLSRCDRRKGGGDDARGPRNLREAARRLGGRRPGLARRVVGRARRLACELSQCVGLRSLVRRRRQYRVSRARADALQAPARAQPRAYELPRSLQGASRPARAPVHVRRAQVARGPGLRRRVRTQSSPHARPARARGPSFWRRASRCCSCPPPPFSGASGGARSRCARSSSARSTLRVWAPCRP